MEYNLFKTLVNDLDCEVVERECYDSQSGWTGMDVFIKQNSTGLYLHENGKFEDDKPKWETYNVSGNGYCLSEKGCDESYQYIRNAIKGAAPDLIMEHTMRNPYRCLNTLYDAIPYDRQNDYTREAYKILHELIDKLPRG